MLIIVYGTLKKGQHNSCMLEGEELIGVAATIEKFNMASIGVPIVSQPLTDNAKRSAKPIVGEVYKINQSLLGYVDQLEGHPVLYKRTLKKIKMLNTREILEAYIYLFSSCVHDVERYFDEYEEEEGKIILSNDGSIITVTEDGYEWFDDKPIGASQGNDYW